ncbi:MAG TPA: hypothetical protein VGN17_27650 [Bryobacteraceae bacterium]
MNTLCKLCEKKRARRYCPGVNGDICPVCCGMERENTIDCPSDCEYLREARAHEKPIPVTEAEFPHKDVEVSEEFLREHEPVVMWIATSLARAMEKARAVDRDAQEALESLIQTYLTLKSGLIYETRPPNPYAAGIQDDLKRAIDEFGKRLAEEAGMHTLRDTDILGTLVFLERLALHHRNGRPRGRSFYDFLREYFPVEAAAEPAVEL